MPRPASSSHQHTIYHCLRHTALCRPEALPATLEVFCRSASVPSPADPDSGGSGGQLYEAACRVREALRGRAALLVVDRTDIVDAAEADGVLLSPKGVLRLVPRAPALRCERATQGVPNESSRP